MYWTTQNIIYLLTYFRSYAVIWLTSISSMLYWVGCFGYTCSLIPDILYEYLFWITCWSLTRSKTGYMMTSSNGTIFRVIGPLCRLFASHRFSLICAWTNGWANNRDDGDFRRHRAHCDATVIIARPYDERAVNPLDTTAGIGWHRAVEMFDLVISNRKETICLPLVWPGFETE